MAIQEAIFAELAADATLATLLDDGAGGVHIYPIVIPQDQLGERTEDLDRMFLTINKISTVRKNWSAMDNPLFQFTASADTYSGANSLRDAIINALECFTGNLGSIQGVKFVRLEGEHEMHNPDTGLYHLHLTIRFRYIDL